MQRFWRIALPTVGLLLFTGESWHSFRVNREIHSHLPTKYFLWSGIRLDTDPANRNNLGGGTCKDGDENCVSWDLKSISVDPGLLDGFLLLTALPAFIFGRLVVGLFGTLGINQVVSFMALMPALICVWYYFMGWLLDRSAHRHSARSMSTPSHGRYLSGPVGADSFSKYAWRFFGVRQNPVHHSAQRESCVGGENAHDGRKKRRTIITRPNPANQPRLIARAAPTVA